MDPRPRTPTRTRAAVAAVACAVVLTLVASACGSSTKGTSAAASSPTSSIKPQNGGSLVVAITGESGGWAPSDFFWSDGANLVASSVMETLAMPGADSGAKPWLAKSWIADAAFDRWLVKLQPNVKFQDGEPFDAAAVKLNLETAQKGIITSQALGTMLKDVKVIDPLTVEVDLNQPWAAFPSSLLDSQAAYMAAPAMLKSPNHGADHPIGTGPFTFDHWTPNNDFRAVRNPNYWGGLDANGNRRSGLPHLDSIDFRVITDNGTRRAALQTGDVNMILTTDPATANAMSAQFDVIKDWSETPDFVALNTAPSVGGVANPFRDIHARLALAYATDARAVAAQVGKGVQVPTGPWSPDNPWGLPADQNGYPGYDLAKAKQEVAAYEQDTGAHSLDIKLSGVADIDTQRIMQVLQAQWKLAGINVAVDTSDSTSLIVKTATSNFEAVNLGNYGYPDPDFDYFYWSKENANGVGKISANFEQYTTPAIQNDLLAGRRSGFVNVRRQAYHDLVKQLNAGVTNIWLYRIPYTMIAAKNVMGLDMARTIPFGNTMPRAWLADLWIKR
ncbi:MAG TPA: ABC transporter substrate-binding protein [Acidimicrobiales bacterium]|nr:ABC transporter substrate-binding protein [Acidimicrobiales bacterium]